MSDQTGPDRDAADLYAALNDLISAYQLRDRNRACYHGISPTQCHALNALIGGGAMRLDGLAMKLNLDKSTMSRAIDSLEELGYVRRHQDPADGRALQIKATRSGRNLHARIERDLVAEQRKVLADLDPRARRQAVEFLRRLARSAQERFSSDLVSDTRK